MIDRNAIPLRERLIFALDVPTPAEALDWVRRLSPEIGHFKVGLELFLEGGFALVDEIVAQGHKVMLDLKYLDIPRTMAMAVRQTARHGVHLATVHAHTTAQLKAVQAEAGQVNLLGVTVLTSMGEEDLRELGCMGEVEDLVELRAGYALACGLAGVVSSGREAGLLRRVFGDDFIIVTPGIRLPGQAGDDQQRVLTPGRAIAAGADYLVAGRPIRQSKKPLATAQAMLEDVRETLEALKARKS